MADKPGQNEMPKINVGKDLGPDQKFQLEYMKKIERDNLERVAKLKKLRRKNLLTGMLLGGAVLSIYIYTMAAVKQEKFLDELDTPVETEK